jgi:hypothetical protein
MPRISGRICAEKIAADSWPRRAHVQADVSGLGGAGGCSGIPAGRAGRINPLGIFDLKEAERIGLANRRTE